MSSNLKNREEVARIWKIEPVTLDSEDNFEVEYVVVDDLTMNPEKEPNISEDLQNADMLLNSKVVTDLVKEPLNTSTEGEGKWTECFRKSMSESKTIPLINFIKKAGDIFKCKECNFFSKYSRSVEAHIYKSHLKNNIFKCCECNYSTVKSFILKSHIKKVHFNIKPFVCSEPNCKYTAATKHAIEAHKLSHLMVRPYKCGECNFSARHSTGLNRHVNAVHLKLKLFACSECDSNFVCKGSMEQHRKDNHCPQNFELCGVCGYKGSKSRMRGHLARAHLKEKLFQCDLCDKKYYTKGDLKKHVICIHSNIPPLMCQECSYTTKSKACLKAHIVKVHIKPQNFKCSMCNFHAPNKYPLKMHFESVHLNIKRFKCNFCDFKAVAKFRLKQHISKNHESD